MNKGNNRLLSIILVIILIGLLLTCVVGACPIVAIFGAIGGAAQ